jgi:predicted CopG family antitoxin
MHRTQIMLEDEQYERLKKESSRTGRSIGELVRSAVDKEYGTAYRERLRQAFREAAGSADPEDFDGLSGEEWVERMRPGLDARMTKLGW